MHRVGRRLIVPGLIIAGSVLVGATAVAAPITGGAAGTKSAVRGNQFQVGDEPAPPAPPAADTTARYRVTLGVEWSQATHPQTLPGNAHTSPAVLATHSESGDVFTVGAVASPGIERVAEIGSTSTLQAELAANASVDSIERGRRIDGAGIDTFDVTLTQAGSLVSIITMLAPSPDWFVGNADVPLFVGGEWIESVTLDLGAYDAGTEDGNRFASNNAATNPARPISGPVDAVFAAAVAEGRFGTLTITRLP